MSKVEAGQTVFILPRYSRNGLIYEAIVTKVGRKNFETDSRMKFDIESMREITNYVPSICYLSRQDFEDEKEQEKLSKELRQTFDYSPKFTLVQLREIKNLIQKFLNENAKK